MRGSSMINKSLILLFKILVMLGCLFGALLFIYPIVYAIINKDDVDGLMRGSKIILCLFILIGLLLAILMFVGYRSFTKTKVNKHPIAYHNVDELMSSLPCRLYADGYFFVEKNDTIYGTIWIYKKRRLARDDYFIVINSSHVYAHEQTPNMHEVLKYIDIMNIHYGFFLFCFDSLKSKDEKMIFNLSKEWLNRGYLTAIAEFNNSTLSFKKISDGFAKKRQHKNINRLLSYFRPC